VQIDHPTTPTSPRNYSLSDIPGQPYYRISVKRESKPVSAAPDGLISNYLHDAVNQGDAINVGPPCGEFTLDPETLASDQPSGKPVVFLAGGIGITPLLAMAKTLVKSNPNTPVYFLQAARNSQVHAFADEVRDLNKSGNKVKVQVLFDQPLADDLTSGKCDAEGAVTTELLRNWTPIADADYYFCGPVPFMENVLSSLNELGIAEDRTKCEFFGPKQAIAV
jgi:nitric oxide dioxygenase